MCVCVSNFLRYFLQIRASNLIALRSSAEYLPVGVNRGAMFIVGNGHIDPRSNSGRGCLYFILILTLIHLGKVCNQLFSLQLWVSSRAD